MAIVRSIEPGKQRIKAHSTEVDCHFAVLTDDSGEKLLHLTTFGSGSRKSTPILIFDDNWVTTSFNWLSFKGDPNRTYRMEEGTLVQIPSEAGKAFDRYLAILDSDGADPRAQE